MAAISQATLFRSPSPSEGEDHLPRRKDGQLKLRWTRDDKIVRLDPDSPPAETEDRLETYIRVFAYCWKMGITTTDPEDPGSWVTKKRGLDRNDIIRHLLANRGPRPPKWFGARSLATSLYFAIDVDSDEKSTAKAEKKPPFADRCRLLETVLARLGIDVHNPTHVLVETTPSGGRHYRVFTDEPYFLYQYQDLLRSAGLYFKSGEFEFYPSETQGFRLPFGFNPRRPGPHPWRDWIRFIDAYRQGRIKRFALAEIHRNLDQAKKKARSRTARVQTSATKSLAIHEAKPTRTRFGTPRRHSAAIPSGTSPDPDLRYQQLVQYGPKSFADAEDLFVLGIRQPGTRTAVLKHLAAHLIFFRGQSSDEATRTLTAWAMHPPHQSKDIQQDLARGTTVVPDHINRLCKKYEEYRNSTRKGVPINADQAVIARAETTYLHAHLKHLPTEDRTRLAVFLLHLLRFAKRHGTAAEQSDRSGWVAEVHVNTVIRKWPGCHHDNYQDRIKLATSLGLLSVTKGAWHNPNGKGRARTYHLAIPIVPENEWVLSYDDALKLLVADPIVATGDQAGQINRKESSYAPIPNHNSRRCHPRPRPCFTPSHRPVYASPLRPQGARGRLAPHPRQRPPQSDANPRLRGPNPGEQPTVSCLNQTTDPGFMAGCPP
jgi:hypothetical protein